MLKILRNIQDTSFIVVAFSCIPSKQNDNYRFSDLQQSNTLVKADLWSGDAQFKSRVEYLPYPDLFVVFASPSKQCLCSNILDRILPYPLELINWLLSSNHNMERSLSQRQSIKNVRHKTFRNCGICSCKVSLGITLWHWNWSFK